MLMEEDLMNQIESLCKASKWLIRNLNNDLKSAQKKIRVFKFQMRTRKMLNLQN